jgi:hypothetical protein
MAQVLFHLVDPAELVDLDEWTRWLEAVLHNPCSIFEQDGEYFLLETKQLVTRLNGLRIEIYSNEHPPPHFHVRSPEIDASFAIEDCRQLTGQGSPRSLKKILKNISSTYSTVASELLRAAFEGLLLRPRTPITGGSTPSTTSQGRIFRLRQSIQLGTFSGFFFAVAARYPARPKLLEHRFFAVA